MTENWELLPWDWRLGAQQSLCRAAGDGSAGALIAPLPLGRKLGASSPANAAENAPEATGDGNPWQSLQNALEMPFPGTRNHHSFSIPPPPLAIYSIPKESACFSTSSTKWLYWEVSNFIIPFLYPLHYIYFAYLIVYLLPVYLLVCLKLRASQGSFFCYVCHQLAQILLILMYYLSHLF